MYIYTNKIFHKHTSFVFTLLGASTASIVCLIQRLSDTYYPEMHDIVVYFSITVFAIAGAIVGKMIFELHYMAMFDYLTKLGNRWYFNIRLNQEIDRIKLDGAHFCIAGIDVDNFKQINDQFGHAAGDRALVNISNIFMCNTRNIDVVVRWGGDEFAIIFPDTDLPSAIAVAKQLNELVLKSTECGGATISIGVVSVEKDWDKDRVFDEVDIMLNKAKETKNSVAAIT